MKPVVVRNIPRADSNACGVLAQRGVSTSHEAYGRIGLTVADAVRREDWCRLDAEKPMENHV